MAPFHKNPKFGNGPRKPFDNRGGQRFGSRDTGGRFGQKELFDAECESCHKRCQVPFRPNGKKPVYCRDCFTPDEQRDGGASRPRFDRTDSRPQRSFGQATPAATPDPRIDGLKRQLDTVQAMLEKLVATVEGGNRAAALTKEMRKYVAADKPADAPMKKAAKPAKATKPTATAKPAARKSPAKAAKPVKKAAKAKKA